MLSPPDRPPVLGILGGLGPLASAEFLRTIYDGTTWEVEQDAPIVLLHSDPSFADRTDAFLRGDCDAMLARLVGALEGLRRAGASRLVICCVTMHYLLPRIPRELRARVISLVDCIFDAVAEADTPSLLLCSTGARRLRLFEHHRRWTELRHRFILPDDRDQEIVHRDIIYAIKRNRAVDGLIPLVDALLVKYGVTTFIAGCTEIHLLAARLRRASGMTAQRQSIDPLAAIAEDVRGSRCHRSRPAAAR